ncbi:disease resistance protein RGA5-like [Miscanthus floridulus]|uniref:disease resistance protein RGA5-like n=1 Tax=Miscanthus floridulus TaxID=154761 RepID=UPI003459EA61
MAEVMASAAATSVMGSVIGKLAAMLTEKYKLAKDVERGIRFLHEELSSMDAVLQMLAEKDDDQIDPRAKDWRSKVRELSYDIEDCIDRFMLNHSHRGSKASFVRKKMRKLKTLLEDGGIAEEIQELKSLVSEQSERGKRYYDINQCLTASAQPVLLDPRAPALFQEASDLVGIDAPREEIIRLLKCEEKQHKVVSIYGIGGQGKTTLAMEVYHKITEAFDCRAFVSVSQTPDMKRLLRDILSQISKSDFDRSDRLETDQQLIRTLRECLKDKRYFILIDDIWSESAWELVRSALPRNDNGSRIITTTRIEAVAKSCCTGIAAQMYQAKPLSDEDSQRLFFKRLFFSSDDCHPDLRKVSDDILKKCCGLPLAIISIAGLLANRSKSVEVWVNVLRSIVAAVDKDSPIDKMKRILLLSYFDLPHHLKSCLLYLSVFPEDYLIDCRQLILLWVAEGLIPGQDRESMEQLGRSYLNELINRSLVQPTKVGADGTTVKQCRVHDVILEFIVSKAVEDNFVTIWNGNGFSKNYSSNKVRRLSIQKDISARAEEIAKTIKNAPHIRSINIFGFNSVLVHKHASEFLNSQVLRVLNIESQFFGCNLGHVKSFGQLKYLRAGDQFVGVLKLPEDIEKLQHLETLDLRGVDLENLPASIMLLQKLVRLFVHDSVHLPDGIRNLQALEELSVINLNSQSVEFIQGLGDLTYLKVLGIYWPSSTELRDTKDHKEACISTVSRLFRHLRELRVWDSGPDATCSFMASCVPTPPPLQRLLLNTHNLNRVGPQISSLVNLSRLYIIVCGEAGKEGINILASLPMLLSLTVNLSNDEDGDSSILYARHAISRQGFQRLVKFNLCCRREAALKFEPGAMPKLQRLKLRLLARCQFKFGEGGLVLGLQNLGLGLKHVAVDVDCSAAVADEVEALEDDIRGAAGVHPNSPILQVERQDRFPMAHGCSRRPSDHSTVEA